MCEDCVIYDFRKHNIKFYKPVECRPNIFNGHRIEGTNIQVKILELQPAHKLVRSEVDEKEH
jgi:hypothetical protein